MAADRAAADRPLENTPLRVRIADRLRAAIVDGNLKPGQPLTETSLAAQFRVSRAPLREAMRILGEEGLLETVPYKGTTVRRLTRRDVEELYSLRQQLEAFAIQRIHQGGGALKREPLDALCAEMESAARAGDWPRLNAADAAFHRALVELADHRLLASIWSTLALRMQQLIALRNEANRDPFEVAGNHPPIVDAIDRGDIDSALVLLSRHIQSAADLELPE